VRQYKKKREGDSEMAGLSREKIKEICEKNHVCDENLINALTEIIKQYNEDDNELGAPLFV
jgi:arsenate reductase-like glutaredoxin family protein